MKKYYLLIAVLLVAVNCFSQAPQWAWAKSAIGTYGYYEGKGTSVCSDAAGNVYATGVINPYPVVFGSTTINPGIFITKYDDLGNLIWAKNPFAAISEGICSDASGNIYITGWFTSVPAVFDTITLPNNGFVDFFIAKYDPSGNILWAKSAGGSGDDRGYGISTDGAGNVVVTGAFDSGSVSFGSTTLNNTAGFYNVFTVKYDTNGNVLWAKNATTSVPGSCEGFGVAEDNAGNVFVTGAFVSPGITFGNLSLTNPNSPYDEFFILKYDISGNIVWAKNAVGTLNNFSEAISADSFGNVYAIGFGSQFLTFDTTIANGMGSFFVKYNSSGNVVWAKRVPIEAYGICTDNVGSVFITGTSGLGPFVFGTTNFASLNEDIILLKYDSLGNPLWGKNVAGDYDNQSNSICTDAIGNIYITGYSSSDSLTFGTTTFVNDSSYFYNNTFLAKLGNISIGIVEIESDNLFKIAPNPLTSQTTISFNEPQKKTTIKITDILGKEIITLSGITGKEVVIEKGTMKAGIYFVQITDAYNNIVNRKIVVQ